jgi:hypothetical protein
MDDIFLDDFSGRKVNVFFVFGRRIGDIS